MLYDTVAASLFTMFGGIVNTPWKFVVLCGRSGAGKTVLFNALHEMFPELTKSVRSTTTRASRPGDDQSYYLHVTDETFDALLQAQEFLWTVSFREKRYGTMRSHIEEALHSEGLFLLVVTYDVVPKLLEIAPDQTCLLYLLDPGETVLRERLRKRGDGEEAIETSLATSRHWDAEARCLGVPFVYLTNDGTPEELVAAALPHIFPGESE